MSRTVKVFQPVQFYPGRYAAIDVGSHSVQLLVADVDEEGRLTSVSEGARNTRLSERYYVGHRLIRPARERTSEAVADFTRLARRLGAESIAAVGTSVLREAANGSEFRTQVRQDCGLPIEVITGEQEAELAYMGNLFDRRLPPTDGERVVIDIGGGSTEIVRGIGATIRKRDSYRIGAVRLTEQFIRSDPPSVAECVAADAAIEEFLARAEPLPGRALLLGAGGTIQNLASVAKAAGMIHAREVHGAVLPHAVVAELVDLFRSLPLKFRKRVPGLEPDRADVILGGTMILHQAMALVGAHRILVSANGVRHGCVYAMAQRALLKR
ncbi:MAG: exopolyphosphatase [Armatimonadetes bacterium]|jgi:exopolyphosphatase/guanosine-5'-triphosphate,3'-diphosphate pyrophosphatase|nr:exopolyphosphatase [Armatimonadota bacterium]